ncbi:MAG: hypothetical protein ACI9O6_002267 [Glaciecola sp.]|jgi:hypothetical protein
MMNKSNDNRLDEALEKRIEQMALDKQPERDLWKGIEQAIELDAKKSASAEKSHTEGKHLFRSPKPMFAMAASFLVLVVVGWMSFESGKNLQGENLVAAMSEQHNLQKQSLLIRFKDQPASTDNWQQQIEELDEAAQAIKKALAQEPNNPALLKMLKNVYEQQMAIIERVHEPRWERI